MRAPENITTGTIWSLWEMVHNFSFAGVNHLIGELELSIQVSRHNMDHVAQYAMGEQLLRESERGQEAIKQSVDGVKLVTEAVPSHFGWLKCSHIDDTNRRLARWATGDEKKWSELNTRARALRDAIDTELKRYLFYQYPIDRANLFKAWKSDWEKSLAAFPAIQWDVYEATDCYALQHNTASVFHSMRVAEIGLRALAGERRVRLPKDKLIEWANWQEIIRAIESEVKEIGKKRAGPTKDAALEFYSGALTDLNGFKDEYRNMVMHVRRRYDEFQALRALTLVRGFMDRMSARIDHTHKPIKWGRF